MESNKGVLSNANIRFLVLKVFLLVPDITSRL